MTLFVFDYLIKQKFPVDSYWETAVVHAETKERATTMLNEMVKGRIIDRLECAQYDGEYIEAFPI